MRFELHHHPERFIKQHLLAFDLAYKTKIEKQKQSLFVGVTMLLLSVWLFLDSAPTVVQNIGKYVLICGGICMIVISGNYVLYMKRFRKQHEKMLNELSDKYVKNPRFVYEFKDDVLYYEDYKQQVNCPWQEFSKYEVVNNTLFLYNKNQEISLFWIYEEEIGKEKFDELILFLRNKIPVTE